MDYQFVEQFRGRAQARAGIDHDKRLWAAYARGCVITAAVMTALFVLALFGVG